MNILLLSVLLIATLGFSIWSAMLLFGIVHTFWTAIPALGFWQTAIVMVWLNILVPRIGNGYKND